MIKRITIKNFRSLKDVTVDLQDVNLFIGPNNSGKSNFFKALEFLSEVFEIRSKGEELYKNNYFQKQIKPNAPIEFAIEIGTSETPIIYKLSLFNIYDQAKSYYEFFGFAKTQKIGRYELNDIESLDNNFLHYLLSESIPPITLGEKAEFLKESEKSYSNRMSIFHSGDGKEFLSLVDRNFLNNLNVSLPTISYFLKGSIGLVLKTISNIKIYDPEPSAIKQFRATSDQMETINNNASNLVTFLDRLRDVSPEILTAIEKDIHKCVGDFVGIRFDRKKVEREDHRRLGLIDQHGVIYWANELSDGVLYFVALLSIVHQPNPPKLLLLEEPEKGIHPRRIRQVIDYIFQLAEDKGIQIIISSHSTYVVDEFKDIPEAVFVFDKEGGETKINNLQKDVIEPSDKKSDEAGLPHINYTKSLGDHWAIGFIGGIPQ